MQKVFPTDDFSVAIHGKKKHLKIEYRLLNDIVAKSITTKAYSFDSYTADRFEIMAAISKGMSINWPVVLFSILTAMVSSPSKQHIGFVVQLGELFKHLGVAL